MCPYMRINEGELPLCEPKKMTCTMCVVGNMKTYKEIENEAKKMGSRVKG